MSLINRIVALVMALAMVGCSSATTPPQTAAASPTASTVQPSSTTLPLPKGGASTTRKDVTRCQNKTSEVTFTIDDRISSQKKLDGILKVLKKNNVRAYFFLLGNFAKKHPKMMKQIKVAGHVVGNHSYNHANFTAVKKAYEKKNSDGWKAVLTDQIKRGVQGNTSTKLLRPPYGNGAFDKDIQKLAKSLGYGMCYWTVDTLDWSKAKTKSVKDILRRVRVGEKDVTSPVSKGGVILLHGTSRYGAASLQGIIDIVRKKGLKLQRLYK